MPFFVGCVISIRSKLIATYLFISALTAFLIYVLISLTSEQRIGTLAKEYQTKEMSQEILNWYIAEQQWVGFADYFHRLHPPPEVLKGLKNTDDGVIRQHGILDADNRALLRYAGYQEGELVEKSYLINALPILYNGKVIAKIIPPDIVGLSLNSELQVFLDNLRDVLIIAVAVGVFISLLMGIILARFMLRPIESLTQASTLIADGRLQQEVAVNSNDEIGVLAQSFNKMSRDLASADRQRRQLTADITHDLGTPIQVISGYIEMAQDGVLTLNQERLDTIAQELQRVNRLIEDMGLLAKTDAKTLSLHLAFTSIAPMLQRVVRLYQARCNNEGIRLRLVCPDNLNAELDEERMVQVLGNLISNALRYTSRAGEIALSAEIKDSELIISVCDTGCGIEAGELPFVFDRFYRSDSARGAGGKMGLGLSISKGLVEMHRGTISVDSDGESGSCFQIQLPIENNRC